MWHGLILNYNYQAEGVEGFVHACKLNNGFVTGFRWFLDKSNKTPFRMRLENFTQKYHLSGEQ